MRSPDRRSLVAKPQIGEASLHREAPDRRSLVTKPTAPLNRLVAKPTAKPSDQIGEVQCEKEREQRLSRESRLEREKHA